jgi:hypothetical protein
VNPPRRTGGGTPRLAGPWLLLALGVAAAVTAVALDRLRAGAYLLAASIALTAVLRAVLPERWSGAVAVRSRQVDVLLLAGTAVGALVLARTLRVAA